jgi:glycosyl transferase family 25
MAPKPKTAIRVINLDRSVDRRQAFTQMAHDTKLDWAFFPAHTGATKPLQYDDRVATRRVGRPLSPSEIGCYASHFKLWEWLANSDYDQAIILEDDVIVDWLAIEQMIVTRFDDYEINLLRLYISYPFNWKIVEYKFFSPNFHLVRTVGLALGAVGYLLTKTAAQTLCIELRHYCLACGLGTCAVLGTPHTQLLHLPVPGDRAGRSINDW